MKFTAAFQLHHMRFQLRFRQSIAQPNEKLYAGIVTDSSFLYIVFSVINRAFITTAILPNTLELFD